MRQGDRGLPAWNLYAVALLAGIQSSAYGLVVSTYNGPGTPSLTNTTAPADDPGWANASGKRSAIYLGDQWVVTANHVPTDDLELPGGTYELIPGSEILLSNPTFFDANGNSQIDGVGLNSEALSGLSDIKLYRVNTETTTGMTPEQMDPNVRWIDIATQAGALADDVTAISKGAHRTIHPTNPNGRWRFGAAPTYTPTTSLSSPNEGFYTTDTGGAPNPRVKMWGTNQVANANTVGGVVSNSSNGIVRVAGLNDTIGQFTQFDRGVDNDGIPLGDGGTFDEFQGAAGDSGGGIFIKNALDEWVLQGVMHAIYLLPNQPSANPTLYGSFTAFSDLSQPHYASQIAALRASDLYSVLGDIDLDGSVTGEIVNGTPTGDVAALVAGWGHNQASGDIISWKNGDLNQDGLTNLADFALLRDALGGTISVSSFSQLVTVPEPSALCIALGSLALMSAYRRRR